MSVSNLNFDTGVDGFESPERVSLEFLAPAVLADELGRLAHYRILKVLGQGGMGIVLLAEDTQLQRSVALKVIRPEIGQSLSNRQRFLREARAMAQLKSDHVVTVHQVGQEDDVCYLAMELLDGEPLDQWLDRAGTPNLSEAIRIGRETATALAAAHARALIHRDVKPANIWLEGPARRVKLLDFGLARPQDAEVNLTKSGVVLGTPMYMAPEQATGEALDGRADLFSLGCVLYLMATGRPPFEGKTSMAVLTAVVTQTPVPPNQANPAISDSLNDLITRLLAKDPNGRPASAQSACAELLSLEHGLPQPSERRGTQATQITSLNTVASPSELLWSGVQPVSPSAETPIPSTSTPFHPRSRIREAERRQVTVLVCGCGLFESEAYLGLEAEDQAQVLRAFQQVCDRVVRNLDGAILQCNEQGLIACFGYPVAHEDAARRAARTSLKLLEEVKALGGQFRPAHNLTSDPWIGLHTGSAIVEVKEDTVSLVGDARNVAVRLKGVAAPGQVICTDAAHRLFQGRFQCTPLGSRTIAGIARPISLFAIEKLAPTGSLFETATPAELSPLMGRDHEISLLKDRWEQAQDGAGQIILIVGEPGLGKSRLVHSIRQHVLGQHIEGEVDTPVIEWRASPHYQNTGLHPAIDFYERALGFRPEDPPQDRFDRMLKRVAAYDLDRPEVVPIWASLLSLPTPARFPPLNLPPVRQREETFRLMQEWLHTRASRGPILFIVEDLHWVDASTLEFLGQFLTEFSNDRILAVLTFRPEFKPPWPGADQLTRLALTRLNRRQVGDLMRNKAGGTLPEAVIEQIFDRVGGVPLFVEEYAKMVQESSGDANNPSSLGPGIPSTLQDLVMARLDRMEGGRELAQLAAVLGREFSHELLAAIAGLDEPALQAELTQLAQAEILYAKGRPPRCTYYFKHALLEDALYSALVKAKRQQYHLRVAEALQSKFPQTVETRPELLAHHFTEAGRVEQAIDFWLKAGLRSQGRSALSEAIGHLTKGLSLLESLGESPERDNRELQLLTALAPAHIAARGYAAPEVGPVLSRAAELCRRAGESRQQFGIMLGMWEWRLVRGDLRLCVELAAEGLALAEQMNDPGMRMEALFMPGVTHFYRGNFAEARACFENALASFDDRERTKYWTAYTGHDAGVTHRCYLALALWHLGDPNQARKLDRETRDLARTIGHAFSLGHAVDFSAYLHQYCRLGTDMLTAAEEEVAIGTEQGFQLWQALGTLHKGAAMLLQGNRDEALSFLLKGYRAFRATGAEVRIPTYLGLLAEAYTQVAKFEEAHGALIEAFEFAEKNDDRSHEPELHRLRGELLIASASSPIAEAEVCFRRAIEIARRQGSRSWELRASISLARHLQRTGRGDEAAAALASVYHTYSKDSETPDLRDARAILSVPAPSA